MDINQTLELIGLKDKEVDAYLALLRLDSANAHQVAKEAKLERTTVYKVLENLCERELVTKSARGKRLVFRAEHPQALKSLINNQDMALTQIMPLLLAIRGSERERPVIRFYEHQDGLRKVLNDSLNCKEKIRRDFAFVENVVELFGSRFIHKHIENRVKAGIEVRSLRKSLGGNNDSSKNDWYLKKENKDLLRETRYLPSNLNFDPLIMIYDNTVAVISSKKETYAFVVESPEFSQAMKTLFDIAWAGAKS